MYPDAELSAHGKTPKQFVPNKLFVPPKNICPKETFRWFRDTKHRDALRFKMLELIFIESLFISFSQQPIIFIA